MPTSTLIPKYAHALEIQNPGVMVLDPANFTPEPSVRLATGFGDVNVWLAG